MTLPPHLPPPACDLKIHRLGRTFSWIFLILAIAIPASFAASLVTVAWILPTTVPNVVNRDIDLRSNGGRETSGISAFVASQVQQRVWNIYDRRQKVNNSFYPGSALIGRAIMISSDGWAVAYVSKYTPGSEKNWEGLDSQGLAFPVSKVLVDSINGVIFLKISGQGYRVVSFANWGNTEDTSSVWSLDGALAAPVSLQISQNFSGSRSLPIYKSLQEIKITPNVAVGSILINKSGDFVGLADKDSNVIPSNLVEKQVGYVLDEGKIKYESLPWKGYSVYGTIMENGVLNTVGGFLITDSPTKPGVGTIGVGDIVIKLQQEKIKFNSLSLNILEAPNDIVVTVLRNKELKDIIVHKTIVQ